MYEQSSTVDTTTSVDLGPSTKVELVAEVGDIGALRGVTEAAADLSECTCPEPCERDHANE
jgi:hypothetical protein